MHWRNPDSQHTRVCRYVMSSFTSGFVLNSAYILVAARVSTAEQTKNQANLAMSLNVGALYGTLIWGGVLYDATATGLEAMEPLAYIGVLYLVATVLVFRAGHEDGWQFTFSLSGEHGGIDSRDKFLAVYKKRGCVLHAYCTQDFADFGHSSNSNQWLVHQTCASTDSSVCERVLWHSNGTIMTLFMPEKSAVGA